MEKKLSNIALLLTIVNLLAISGEIFISFLRFFLGVLPHENLLIIANTYSHIVFHYLLPSTISLLLPWCVYQAILSRIASRNEQNEREQNYSNLTKKKKKIPSRCRGCQYLYGKRHGGNLLVCAMHPYGQKNCSDYVLKSEDYQDDGSKVRIKVKKNWIDDCVSIFFTSSLINGLYSILVRLSWQEIRLAILLGCLGILGKVALVIYRKKQETWLNLGFKKYAELYAEQPGVYGWKIRKGQVLFLPPEEILKKLQEEFNS